MKRTFAGVCGELVKRIFTHNIHAEIIAVHSESVYLRAEDGRLILLCPYKYGCVPFGFALQDWESFRTVREYMAGEVAEISCGKLCFSDGDEITLLSLKLSVPQYKYKKLPDIQKLGFCADYLFELASDRGIAPSVHAFLCLGKPSERSNAYALRALSEADRFERALVYADSKLISEAVSKYIGLGYGLTPSGDDFLCGMLYTFARLKDVACMANKYATALADAVLSNLEKTNEVSREYLLCACDGVEFEITDAVIAVLSDGYDIADENEQKALSESMRALLSVGASSGSDILCGILFGLFTLSHLSEDLEEI